MQVPVIDFSAYGAGAAEPPEALVSEVHLALREMGFMVVSNVGLGSAEIDHIFAVSREFFSADEGFKQCFGYRDAAENFGYQAVGAESLHPGMPGDLKESFTLRLNAYDPPADERFPSPAFKASVTSFYEESLAAARRLLQVIAQAFELPLDYFTAPIGGENVSLRLLHYPGRQAPAAADQLGAGAHTDYGILTLLFQDDVGGLEVRDSEGKWQPVPCIPGAIVINTGDLMHRWTNGSLRSTEHRVLPVSGPRDRYSVALFVDPDSDTLVEVLPQCVDADNPARFGPITAGEHLRQKLTVTHNL